MKAKKIIDQNALKFTHARELLLDIFQQSEKPLCYQDIKEQINMDKATFYRNMHTFEEKGIMNGFESSDKKRYYELHKKNHAHFICSSCHKVKCLDALSDFQMTGYEIDNIIIYGKCQICQNNA